MQHSEGFLQPTEKSTVQVSDIMSPPVGALISPLHRCYRSDVKHSQDRMVAIFTCFEQLHKRTHCKEKTMRFAVSSSGAFNHPFIIYAKL